MLKVRIRKTFSIKFCLMFSYDEMSVRIDLSLIFLPNINENMAGNKE